jgi:RNA polymerase sigma factor (sigma-70 family)
VFDFGASWERARSGDAEAREFVYGQVYTEARRLAQARWAVDELITSEQSRAIIDKVGERVSGELALEETLEFIAYAASVMRGVICDLSETRRKLKKRREFGEMRLATPLLEVEPAADVEVLDHLIDQLQDLDPLARAVVEMRLYADLSIDEIAVALHQQPEPVEQRWTEARTLLQDALGAG